jgi:sugar phosphate isomerase/epimerase
MTRRELLQLTTAGAALSARAFAASSAAPSIAFPTSPRQRLAVASYPFRKDFDPATGKLKLVDFPKMVVERFQVNGIEPLDTHFPSTEPSYLDEFRKALEATGTHVVDIPVGRLQGSFYDKDASKRETAVANAKRWVDVAAALGSPGIRVHIQSVKGLGPDATRAAQSLAEVAAYAERKRIVVSLENDDPASEEAFFIIDVIERANTSWLRALPDFGNSMLLNKGEEYNYRAVAAMFRHAYAISHVKEVETDDGKLFRIDLAKTFAIAKQTGYKGYFSVEWDSDGDPYAGTQDLIGRAVKLLA